MPETSLAVISTKQSQEPPHRYSVDKKIPVTPALDTRPLPSCDFFLFFCVSSSGSSFLSKLNMSLLESCNRGWGKGGHTVQILTFNDGGEVGDFMKKSDQFPRPFSETLGSESGPLKTRCLLSFSSFLPLVRSEDFVCLPGFPDRCTLQCPMHHLSKDRIIKIRVWLETGTGLFFFSLILLSQKNLYIIPTAGV